MKSVLITGANRGIGFELVKQYLKAGWRVIACCRNPDEATALNNLNDPYLMLLALNVDHYKEVEALASRLKNESIDILINNAGMLPKNDVYQEDLAECFHAFHVNTIAPAQIANVLLPKIMKGQDKVIANISSLMGSIANCTGSEYMVYRMTKVALNSVSKCLSNAYKEQKIKVVSIDPGWVKTDMGGPNAMIMPEESVTGIRQVLASLTLADSGGFIRYNGEKVAF